MTQTEYRAEPAHDKPIWETHPIVFVAGLHRSGTTLIHDLLRNHPDVSGFRNTGVPMDEGQHLQDVYQPAKVYGGAGRFGFNPASYLDESSSLNTRENARRLWDQWSKHWDLSRPLLLEKSPPNLVRTRFLQAMFPQASFLVIVRNPVVVAMATRKGDRRSKPIDRVTHWIACYSKFEQDRPHLNRVRVVRYEDLIADTENILAEVQSFLGLSSQKPKVQILDKLNDTYMQKWVDYLASHGRAAKDFVRVREDGRELMERYGYSADELAPAITDRSHSPWQRAKRLLRLS